MSSRESRRLCGGIVHKLLVVIALVGFSSLNLINKLFERENQPFWPFMQNASTP